MVPAMVQALPFRGGGVVAVPPPEPPESLSGSQPAMRARIHHMA